MYPVASHDIVNVVTQRRGFGADTSAETKLAVGDEGGPFVVLLACTEGIAVNQTANYNEIRYYHSAHSKRYKTLTRITPAYNHAYKIISSSLTSSK